MSLEILCIHLINAQWLKGIYWVTLTTLYREITRISCEKQPTWHIHNSVYLLRWITVPGQIAASVSKKTPIHSFLMLWWVALVIFVSDSSNKSTQPQWDLKHLGGFITSVFSFAMVVWLCNMSDFKGLYIVMKYTDIFSYVTSLHSSVTTRCAQCPPSLITGLSFVLTTSHGHLAQWPPSKITGLNSVLTTNHGQLLSGDSAK